LSQLKIENRKSKILHALTGPTAAGKTAVGLELARRMNAEIVSLDSMAVYRGMDIGTAKPNAEERRHVPHHLLDIVDPSEEFSVAQYLHAALAAAEDIESRGRLALFVGGTPLYLKALLRGLFEGPPADWPLRRRLAQIASSGSQALHDRLREVDPTAAARLHPRDTRRLIRALEVHETTGRPISDWQREFNAPRPADTCRVFALDWPSDALRLRIDARVDAMFAAGLVDEVRGLTVDGHTLGRSASQAVGYREVLEHLSGARDLASTIALVKTRTHQFAKRQRTWFRGLAECRPVPVLSPLDATRMADELVARMR
jgi:tRNA dimethylallyltransferase